MKIRQTLILPVLVLLAQPELASARRIHSDSAPPAAVQAVAAQGKAYCSIKTLKGTYSYSIQGYSTETGVEKAFAEAGMESYDGRGNIKGNGSDSANPTNSSFTGTYTINPDCTGTLNYEGSVYNIYVQPNGNSFQFIDTTPGSVLTGQEIRVNNALIIR